MRMGAILSYSQVDSCPDGAIMLVQTPPGGLYCFSNDMDLIA